MGVHLLSSNSRPATAAVWSGTGILAYPTYRYYQTEDPKEYMGNPWILSLSAPSGGINFDEFLYFPRQNYHEIGYGGCPQRIRDWAYLHE